MPLPEAGVSRDGGLEVPGWEPEAVPGAEG